MSEILCNVKCNDSKTLLLISYRVEYCVKIISMLMQK